MTQVALKTDCPSFYRGGGGKQKEKHPTVCRLNNLLPSPVLGRVTAFSYRSAWLEPVCKLYSNWRL